MQNNRKNDICGKIHHPGFSTKLVFPVGITVNKGSVELMNKIKTDF